MLDIYPHLPSLYVIPLQLYRIGRRARGSCGCRRGAGRRRGNDGCCHAPSHPVTCRVVHDWGFRNHGAVAVNRATLRVAGDLDGMASGAGRPVHPRYVSAEILIRAQPPNERLRGGVVLSCGDDFHQTRGLILRHNRFSSDSLPPWPRRPSGGSRIPDQDGQVSALSSVLYPKTSLGASTFCW